MFKAFKKQTPQFNGFPNLNFQMNNEAYGFSGCKLWLDAGLYVNNGNPADGSNVSSWVDKMKGVIFTQATGANQPLYVASEANFNNLPALNFSSSRSMTAESATGFSNEGVAVAFVYKNDLINQVYNALCVDASGSLTGGVILTGGTRANVGGVGVYIGANAENDIMDSGVEDTSPHICVITNTQIIVDGVQTTTGTWSPQFSFGSLSASSVNALKGKLAELLVYDGFSDDNAITLSDILNSKYAIY